MTWSVEGTYIEACNCEAACPCIFLSPPTEGECSVLVGWHIDKGRHGDAVLDGLNAALIAFAPGNMKDGQWKVALYLDIPRSRQNPKILRVYDSEVVSH